MNDFSFEKDPFENLLSLLSQAEVKKIPEHNAMTLSTVGLDGKPSSRLVLFKGLIRNGLSFYTNYKGRKAGEILKNPAVALNFFWPTLQQQIRIEGRAEKTTREESEIYFRQRPRESQIGAWASLQSEILSGTEELSERYDEIEKQYAGQEIPCPLHWGGFIVRPEVFEFWFGKRGRLHERYVYEKSTPTSWKRLMKFP